MLVPIEIERRWAAVAAEVAAAAPGTRVRYPKAWLPHPREAGAVPSVGLPLGQRSDFRFPPDAACRGLHAQEYDDAWVVHVDVVHPACDLLGDLRTDAPGTWTLGAAALGGFAGAALTKKGEGVVAGLLIGLALGALTVAWQKKLADARCECTDVSA